MSKQVIERKKVTKVVVTLKKHFPQISESNAYLQACALADAPGRAGTLHHHGKKDRAALQELHVALEAAHLAITQLSHWAHQALWAELHDALIAMPEPVPNPRYVGTPAELARTTKGWAAAAARAEQSLDKGRPSNGKNWRAVAVIEEARRVWKKNTGIMPSKTKLREEKRFAGFLRALFDDLSVGANLESAHRAWRLAALDPHSLLEPLDEPSADLAEFGVKSVPSQASRSRVAPRYKSQRRAVCI
jgi:hypothetical protein